MNMNQKQTPRELVSSILGYVPDGTPETWDEVEQEMIKHYPDFKPGDYYKINSYGWALSDPNHTPPLPLQEKS